MTTVRIARVEPRPGRLADGTIRVNRFLVVLADESEPRALPVWLPAPDGDSLWRLVGRPDGEAGMAGVAEETAGRLLHAAGATVTRVDVEVTGADIDEVDPEVAVARIELARATGTSKVTAGLGYGFSLAAAVGAPIRVADAVMDQLARQVEGEDLLAPFLPPVSARPVALRPGRRWRFEPSNLAFSDGLDRWELDGSFLREVGESHRQDYRASAEDRSVVLQATVPEPYGSAVLEQVIFADDYRGLTVTFGGEVRAENVAGRARLFLRAGAQGLPRPAGGAADDGADQSAALAGSRDWTGHRVTAAVPGDADVIRFGISLTGSGRVHLRSTELTPMPDR
jgi:hypothetical protein